VASFAGFAPINNPEVSVVVVLDTPIAPAVYQREGGWVAAPVFHRITQQVLEYLHTPHDLEIPASRQSLLASAKTQEQDKDLEEGSPDHPGEEIETADTSSSVSSGERAAGTSSSSVGTNSPGGEKFSKSGSGMIPAAMRERIPSQLETQPNAASVNQTAGVSSPMLPANGTVVLDVEQNGITVPSFQGKSVRSAIELAESSGLDLDVVGSGLGREQNPPAGSHVVNGSRITVRFGR
jgi:cell division protein FtsI (penicillin-binding protein 3)